MISVRWQDWRDIRGETAVAVYNVCNDVGLRKQHIGYNNSWDVGYFILIFKLYIFKFIFISYGSLGCNLTSRGGIFLKISVLNPMIFRNKRNTEFLWAVCDYIDVTQFGNQMFSYVLRQVFLIFSHFKSIDVTPFILKLWCILCAACGTVWSRLCGVSVQQVVLWRVCVGIVWL